MGLADPTNEANNIDDKLQDSNLEVDSVPYLLVDGYPTGTIEYNTARFTEKYIIHASNLLAFMIATFPPPQFFANGFPTINKRRLPGFNAAVTRSINFEPFPSGKPVDPFWADPRHDFTRPDELTPDYARHLMLTIEYEVGTGERGSNNNPGGPDSSDPDSFLEVSATAAGEFINTYLYEPQSENDRLQGVTPVESPHMIMIPEIEWNIAWSYVPNDFMRDNLVPAMRNMLGKVNDAVAPQLLYKAPKETLLFLGWSQTQVFTWQHELDGVMNGINNSTPYVHVDMKILEKRIQLIDQVNVGDPDKILGGHNHGWKHGEGVVRLFRDKDETPLYFQDDFESLFDAGIALP